MVLGNEEPEQTRAEASSTEAPGEDRRGENGARLYETGRKRGTHTPPGSALKEVIVGHAARLSGWFKRKIAVGDVRLGDSNHDREGSGPERPMRGMNGNLLRWFEALPGASKVVVAGLVVIAVFGLLVLLSPLALLVAAVAFAVSVTVLAIHARRRMSVRGWGIAAVVSLVLAFVFGGMTYAVYGTGPSGGDGSKSGKAAATAGSASGSKMGESGTEFDPEDPSSLVALGGGMLSGVLGMLALVSGAASKRVQLRI